jgi:adenylyltransferase/sulfurtransferase
VSIIPDKRLIDLDKDEISRYSRHLLLPEVGIDGQKRLKAAKVLLVGAGGLGSPLALYLAAAGVGTIGIVDPDHVEASNLQRQIIHSTRDIDRPKTESAKDRLRGLNPFVHILTYHAALTSANAMDILHGYDVVADGTDNYQTRYLVNDACVLLDIPNVYGSIFQFEGQATVFHAADGPCYRCLYPAPPPPGLVPSCAEGGVVGVLPGIVGAIQACEVIKLIVGESGSLIGRLLLFDAWRMKFREVKLEKDPACPVCGENPVIDELIDYEQFCGLGPQDEDIDGITPLELKTRLDKAESLLLVDVREQHERKIFAFEGARPMPFGQVARRMDELDPRTETVFICKVGRRSALAIRALRDAGYTGRMLNLLGGTNAWARDVDNSLPQY